jgi:hypothetical protein
MQGRYAEGMHLVEHILLRPQEGSNVSLKPVTFNIDGSNPQSFVEDPYSFQVSIFLPRWAPRFNDAEFRGIVERTLRQEMSAHILPWIYWVDLPDEHDSVPTEFIDFENAYLQWLLARQSGNSVEMQDAFIEKFNALVQQPWVSLTNETAYRPFNIE